MSIKLIAFDVDGTLVEGNIWERLHKAAGISSEEDYRYYQNYYEKKITFKQWIDWIEKRYLKAKITRSKIESVIIDYTLVKEAVETINLLNKKYKLCLISSGIDIFVRKIAEKLSINFYYANFSFTYSNNSDLQKINYIATEDEAKVIALKEVCQKLSLKPTEIAFVGDSLNDLKAFNFTRRGIYIGNNKKLLQDACWKEIKKISELRSILL